MWSSGRVRNAPTVSSSCRRSERPPTCDPRVGAERDDQVVHAPGRDAVDVGLHHDRVQRLVDPAPRLEDGGEVGALAELGDPQLDVAGLGRHSLGRVPLRSVTRSSVRS